MVRVLVSWIGRSDLIAAGKDQPAADPGPILRLLREEQFAEIHLLNDVQASEAQRGEASVDQYRDWLIRHAELAPRVLQLHSLDQNLRNRYDLAYQYTRERLTSIRDAHRPAPAKFALLLSPGYPAAVVGLIVAHQTLLDPDTELFDTSRERGVERVQLPFFLTADVVTRLQRRWQAQLPDPAHPALDAIIGQSRAMQLAKRAAQKVAVHDQTSVILRGETGTGKEVFARAIHAMSPRSKRAFVALNCAAIPREMLESELFGHVRGAFTGAVGERRGKIRAADGGTLFLDEIGDMALDLQAKLLRFLQERTFYPVGCEEEESADVRILAATHQDLERAVEAGAFRADLYYRLDGVSLHLPPLRARHADLFTLAEHFLADWNQLNGATKTWGDGALAYLAKYRWRGNVRELRNAVNRVAIFSLEDAITAEDLELWLGVPAPITGVPLSQLPADAFACHLAAILDELLVRAQENRLPWSCPEETTLLEGLLHPLLIGRALQATGGNGSAAGRLIGRGSGKGKFNPSSGNADDRRREYYRDQLQPAIDESRVSQLRDQQT